jgi:hypothetical protein
MYSLTAGLRLFASQSYRCVWYLTALAPELFAGRYRRRCVVSISVAEEIACNGIVVSLDMWKCNDTERP